MKNPADSALMKTPEGPQKYADAVTSRTRDLVACSFHVATVPCTLPALEHPAAAAD